MSALPNAYQIGQRVAWKADAGGYTMPAGTGHVEKIYRDMCDRLTYVVQRDERVPNVYHNRSELLHEDEMTPAPEAKPAAEPQEKESHDRNHY